MFRAVTRLSVRMVERYLPDPYIFVLLLTLIAAFAAVIVESQTPMQVINMWGDGFWGVLAFTMQMLLVLVAGCMLASSPVIKRLLERIASIAKSPSGAIILVTYIALVADWINCGFGLVVSALFAKELAKRIKVDYRLLVASAYSAFVVWHGGLAGSVSLTIATEGHFHQDKIGIISTSQTIFSSFNLLLVLSMFIVVPLVNRLMMPSEEESVYIDPEILKAEEELAKAEQENNKIERPADRLETSKILSLLIGFGGLAYLFNYFLIQGGGLNLIVVNFTFISLAIVFHGSARSWLPALQA